MNCNQAEKRIQGALDGALNEYARIELTEHLSSCSDCTVLMDEYLELRRGAGEWARHCIKAADPGEELNKRVLAAIDGRAPGNFESHRRERTAMWLTLGVIAAVAVGASYWVRVPSISVAGFSLHPTLADLISSLHAQIGWMLYSLNSATSTLSGKIVTYSVTLPLIILVLANLALYSRRLGNDRTTA